LEHQTRHLFPNWDFRGPRSCRSDPRAIFRWHEVEQAQTQQRQLRSFARFGRRPPRRFRSGRRERLQRDWSINLGTAGTANAMYPAKFTFDVTVAPSCANDFVVFPVNAAGSAAQPNIVAFQQSVQWHDGWQWISATELRLAMTPVSPRQ